MKAFNEYIKSLENRIKILENFHKTLPPLTPNKKEKEEKKQDDKEKNPEIIDNPLIISKARTPITEDLVFRGRGGIKVLGRNYFVMMGAQPRIYTKEEFLNVEASVDYMAIDDIGKKNWSGCSIGVRSDKEGHSGANPPPAHTYYFRFRKDMKVDFLKEYKHTGKREFLINKKYEWKVNKFFNIKMRCYNTKEGNKLEGYVNDKLVLEYTDKDEKMNEKGIVMIRNTDIKEATYKNFKYKELEPYKEKLKTIKEEKPIFKNNGLLVGYYPEWGIYQHKYNVKDIPDKVDIICYSFMFPNPLVRDMKDAKLDFPPKPTHFDKPEGTLIPHDEYAFKKNMKELKKIDKIKLVSLGGWTLSFNFSKIFRDDRLRKVFVKSIIKFLDEYDFQGVDLDWEYPNKKGRTNNTNMENQYSKKEDDGKYIKLFFKELKELKPDIILMSAIGCNEKVFKAFKGTEDLMDYALLMNYDYSGKTWSKGEPMSDIKTDKKWIKKFKEITDFKDNQIIVGCPLYARGWWKGKDKGTLNFGKPYNEDGMIALKDIEESDYDIKYNLDNRSCYIENDEWFYSFAWIDEKIKLSNKYAGIGVWSLPEYDLNKIEKL